MNNLNIEIGNDEWDLVRDNFVSSYLSFTKMTTYYYNLNKKNGVSYKNVIFHFPSHTDHDLLFKYASNDYDTIMSRKKLKNGSYHIKFSMDYIKYISGELDDDDDLMFVCEL